PRSNRPSVSARWLEYVHPETTAVADAGVGGITVTVGGTSVSTVTDASGIFRLRGDFGGSCELVFTRPEDALASSVVMSAPSGGVRDDLTFDSESVEVKGEGSKNHG